MKKNTFVCASALTVFAASLLVPFSALAILVKYTTVTPGTIATVGYNDNGNKWSGSVYTGVYNLEVDGKAMQSFCIDIFQHAPTSEKEYGFGSLSDIYGSDAAEDINKLWTAYYTDPDQTVIKAAGAQLALWEITTEALLGTDTTTGYDIKGGGFYAFNDWVSGHAINQAIDYLDNLDNSTATTSLVVLANGEYQDYAAPVPEPATLILLGSGLIGTAFIRRRKSLEN